MESPLLDYVDPSNQRRAIPKSPQIILGRRKVYVYLCVYILYIYIYVYILYVYIYVYLHIYYIYIPDNDTSTDKNIF